MSDEHWTVPELKGLLREADRLLAEERDRRYTELRVADQRALQIKEEADRIALELARENQSLRDEKANGLLAQMKEERAHFPTRQEVIALLDKFDTRLTPVEDFILGQRSATQTRSRAQDRLAPWMIWAAGALVALVVLLANGKLG